MSRTKKEVRIRVTGIRRKEPDIRRIAKAIIRLSLDGEDAEERLSQLADTEAAIARRRKAERSESGEQVAS